MAKPVNIISIEIGRKRKSIEISRKLFKLVAEVKLKILRKDTDQLWSEKNGPTIIKKNTAMSDT